MTKILLAFAVAITISSCTAPAFLSETPTGCKDQDSLTITVSGQRKSYYYCDTTHTKIKKWVAEKVINAGE